MTSDETQIQILTHWPMSRAKHVRRLNRRKPEYHVAAVIRKLRTDTNYPAGKLWPNHVKSEQHIGYKILLNTVQYFLSPPSFFFLLLLLFFSLASNHRERALLLFSRFHLRREFGNGILRNGKGHSLWLARFDRKCRFIFSPLTLFSQTSG